MNNKFHSGFIAILGRPNVGKSTFLNRIIGQKIAIMSDKAQTTRNKIQGIYTTDDAQIVFIDTPGIHKPQSRLGDFMVESALSTLNEVDAVIFMVNAEQNAAAAMISSLSVSKTSKSRFIWQSTKLIGYILITFWK